MCILSTECTILCQGNEWSFVAVGNWGVTVYSYCSERVVSVPFLFSSLQTSTTTTVIAAQPATTTYVQPSQRRNNEAIPTIALVFTLIHLIGCLSFGNLLIIVCLGPALICAIVVSTTTPDAQISDWWRGGKGRGGSHTFYFCRMILLQSLTRLDSNPVPLMHWTCLAAILCILCCNIRMTSSAIETLRLPYTPSCNSPCDVTTLHVNVQI